MSKMGTSIHAIKDLLLSLQRRVDDLVSEALITIKEPALDFGADAGSKDQEISRLKNELLQEIGVILACHQPVARDHRFLLAAMATLKELVSMSACAKDICQRARDMGRPSGTLQVLLGLTQRRVSECFRGLRQLDLLETNLSESRLGERDEVESALNTVLFELERVDAVELVPKELGRQILVALDLKRICDDAANIADQVNFYKTGTYGVKNVR